MYTGIKIECAVPSLTANSTPVRDRAPVTAHIVIGTSGTVHKLMSYKKLGVSRLKVLVFDEADHMLAEVINHLVLVSYLYCGSRLSGTI